MGITINSQLLVVTVHILYTHIDITYKQNGKQI